MENRVRIGGHPIHPMIVPFPIALWIFSLVCDIVFKMGWGGTAWSDAAFYSMAGGIIGALGAAVPGFIDYLGITYPPTKRIATWHLVLNLGLVALFAFNLWIRTKTTPGAVGPIILSFIGVALLGASGWLGGTLVYVHGVAVSSAPEIPPETTVSNERMRVSDPEIKARQRRKAV
jgi:uncharacterized membrane protein